MLLICVYPLSRVGRMLVSAAIAGMSVAGGLLLAATRENKITMIKLCFMNDPWIAEITLAHLPQADRVLLWSLPRVYRTA